MHLIVIGWIYVALMMALAEASASNGSVLGAVITFVLYGVAPVALVLYLLNTPARRRRHRALEAQAVQAARQAAQATTDASTESVAQPDAGGHAPAAVVPPVREPQ